MDHGDAPVVEIGSVWQTADAMVPFMMTCLSVVVDMGGSCSLLAEFVKGGVGMSGVSGFVELSSDPCVRALK